MLNDSGPEFEPEGTVRLMGEVASLPVPSSWADAASMLKTLQGTRYPGLDNGQWQDLAKNRYRDVKGRPAQSYDKAIATSYSLGWGSLHRQSLWPQFAAMARVPMLLLRAELSDMLGDLAVARMRDLHPGMDVTTVPGEGHPALLRDRASIGAVSRFLERNEWPNGRSDMALKAVA